MTFQDFWPGLNPSRLPRALRPGHRGAVAPYKDMNELQKLAALYAALVAAELVGGEKITSLNLELQAQIESFLDDAGVLPGVDEDSLLRESVAKLAQNPEQFCAWL